ncbi:MAG: hypothetical protein ACU84H_00755 [Gammaproteobacteria bacterium]
MYFILILLVTAGFGFVFARVRAGRGLGVYGFVMAWLLGISLAVLIAAMVKPKVDHPGWGVQGEITGNSLEIITAGFWFALLGSALGSLFALTSWSKRK